MEKVDHIKVHSDHNRNTHYVRDHVHFACTCGGEVFGIGFIATGEKLPDIIIGDTVMKGRVPEAGEILSFEYLHCNSCGFTQYS